MSTEPSAAEHTAKDVELLATKLMGWRLSVPEDGVGAGAFWVSQAGGFRLECLVVDWDQLNNASDDAQVLERVREVWGEEADDTSRRAMAKYEWALVMLWAGRPDRRTNLAYRTGDYSRAASVVLREMEEG